MGTSKSIIKTEMPTVGQFIEIWSHGEKIWSDTFCWIDGELYAYQQEPDDTFVKVPDRKPMPGCVFLVEVPDEETITVTKEEFDDLLEDSEWLQCLDSAGVDNWSGYDYARAIQAGEE